MFTKSGYRNMMDLLFRRYTGYAFNRFYRLATNVPGGDPLDVVEDDLTECDFDGYAYIANPTIDDPTVNGSDQGSLITPTLTWTAGSGIAAPQTAKVIYLTIDSLGFGADQLTWWQELDPWVTVANEGETISQIITFLNRNFTP